MTRQRNQNLSIELQYVADCPHVEPTLVLLRECLAELEIEAPIVQRQGDYASPTVLVNGRDVMGEPAATGGAACRCDRPTAERLLDALRAALRAG